MKIRDHVVSIVTVFVSVFTLGVCNLLYTNHVQHQTEEKFCVVIGRVVTAFESQPPSSDLGVQLLSDYRNLYRELGCYKV